MARARSVLTVCLSLALLAACGGGDGGSGGSLQLTAPAGAATDGFAETSLETAADQAFTIHFVNDDTGVPHNVQIFEGSAASGDPVWAPADDAVITGPAEADYQVPALAAGTYTFNCLTHPTTMVGTLTAG